MSYDSCYELACTQSSCEREPHQAAVAFVIWASDRVADFWTSNLSAYYGTLEKKDRHLLYELPTATK